MSAFSILPIAESHLEAVAALESLCFAEPWSANALRLLLQAEGCGFVAVDREQRVLGYGGMLIAPDEAQITNIAVLPESRRLGIGRAMLHAMIGEAAARSLVQLSLEVRESNLAAIALYESFGFFTAGKRKRFYRHPVEDGLVMLKQLNQSIETESE